MNIYRLVWKDKEIKYEIWEGDKKRLASFEVTEVAAITAALTALARYGSLDMAARVWLKMRETQRRESTA